MTVMAKTRGGVTYHHRRKAKSNNNSPTARNLENGLYVHSSPPKGKIIKNKGHY